ncbi:MAG: NERD domain-containing protein [Youngiibacter sp.]|nr:NERD domain-containing protein [Youngiibacter sp.]
MRLFDKLNGPEIFKDSGDARKQFEVLKGLHDRAAGETRKQIAQDMRLLEYGIKGEENVLFELMNSFMPMLVLRDLHLQHEGLSAQIDFLVVTRKLIFVIECKNMFGDIEVNRAGDFIRTLEFDGKKKKEGIYSPITQNKRHLELIKAMRRDNISNALVRMAFEKFFDENYKSIIVLANPKTLLDVSKADKSIRDQIIRNDQLVAYIKEMTAKSKNESINDKTMYEKAESFASLHNPLNKDYTSKYMIERDQESKNIPEMIQNQEKSELYKNLKEFRLNKSREEGVKAYFIFNNSQLDELILKMPDSLESLKEISGFGEVKAGKYGTELIKIIDRHRRS